MAKRRKKKKLSTSEKVMLVLGVFISVSMVLSLFLSVLIQ
jgi:hypothetical protein